MTHELGPALRQIQFYLAMIVWALFMAVYLTEGPTSIWARATPIYCAGFVPYMLGIWSSKIR